MYGYGNSMFLATHGILARTASGGGIDPDAQAFITAASITDPTQQSAINQLVVDLKGYSIWTKMKALYPFVGGTASTHKFNLKDPRDLDAAFRLVFSGGVTHSSNGVQFGGVNGWAETYLNANTAFTTNDSFHGSIYSRTNSNIDAADYGGVNASARTELWIRGADGNLYTSAHLNRIITPNSNSTGYYISTRSNSTTFKVFKNNSQLGSTYTGANGARLDVTMPIGAYKIGNSPSYYSNKQYAFASIGDGLTDTEAANFYTAVQAFQTTLGRSIGTQTVSDADAQAFVTNAGIVDQVEANAINNLVIGLKADSLWTKMKAVYPFVGGTSTTHKYNLVNPLDTDAAFRLVFSGGWTHSANGILGNQINSAFDTKLIPSSIQSINNKHFSVYSRTNTANGTEFCSLTGGTSYPGDILMIREAGIGTNSSFYAFNEGFPNSIVSTTTDSRGLFISTRTGATSKKLYRNGSIIGTSTTASSTQPNSSIKFGNLGGSYWTNKEYAFASIGDGLTDTDANNLNSRVTTFQTALNRQV